MNCTNCNDIIDFEPVIFNNNHICHKCYDVLLFVDNINNDYTRKTTTQTTKIYNNFFKCIKCSYPFQQSYCPQCNTPNPLMFRNNKNKKLKKT